MDAGDDRKFEVEDGIDRMAVDVDGLGVDWANQCARINERIGARRVRSRALRTAWAGAVAAVVVAGLALLIWWRGAPLVGDGQDMDQFFTEMDFISEGYVPEGLYVLNGFIDEQPDAEAMVEFVVPQVGGEEEL